MKKERSPYLVPIPMTTPVVANRPPTLFVENELATSPSPSSTMPKRPVFCAPRALMILAFTRASTAMHAVHNDPTTERVLADESLCATRGAERTARDYLVAARGQVENAWTESHV